MTLTSEHSFLGEVNGRGHIGIVGYAPLEREQCDSCAMRRGKQAHFVTGSRQSPMRC